MDLDMLRLNALLHHAEKLPEDALPHLGALAHLGLWLSGESRRRLYGGVTAIFGYGAVGHKKGLKQLLRIPELDHELRADAAREANRLRTKVSLLQRETVRKFFRALRRAMVLRNYYRLLLDPTEPEGEEVLEAIFEGEAFRQGGLVSRLLEDKDEEPPKRKPGRKNTTADIARFANGLIDQGKSWKEVFVACKSQFPGRVESIEGVRTIWRRHFGGKRS